VYDGPVQARGGGSRLTWSSDGARLAMNFGSRIVVLDPAAASAGQVFRGTDACWIDATHLVAEMAGDLTLLDVPSGTSRRFAANSVRPQCLAAAGSAR